MLARLPLLFALLVLTLAVPLAAQPVDEANRLYRRGLSLLEAGKLEEAARAFEKVLELAERKLGPDDPALAVDLNNLGEVYRRMGRLDRAAELLRRAIRLDEAAGGRGPALATSLNNLGLVLRAQGRLDAAADLYLRALSLLENSLGADHPDTARALHNLAQLELERGDARAALDLQERAAKIARASLGPDHTTTKAIEAALGRMRTGNVGRAPATAPTASASAGAPPTAAESRPQEAGATRPLVAPPIRSLPPPSASASPTPAGKDRALSAGAQPDPAPATASRPAPAAPGPTPAATPAPTTAGSTVATAGGSPAVAGRGFRLHLASGADKARLPAEWARLEAVHPSLRGLELLPAEPVEIAGKGTFWRLVAGRFPSRAAAEAACAPVKARGGFCTVLGP